MTIMIMVSAGMKILLAILLLSFQAGQKLDKWECRGDSDPLPKDELTQVKSSELKKRVVACAVPELPGTYDAQGTVILEVQIDKDGNVRCVRVLSGVQDPVMRHAALEAARQWKFEPLKVEGQAKPYASLLGLVVHWDREEAGKQCLKSKR